MKNILFTLISVVVLSCSPYKKDLVSHGNKNQTIKNAIIDFSNTSRLYRKHFVFKVQLIDTLYSKKLEKIDERNYRWVDDVPYIDFFVIRIAPVTNQYTYLLSDSLGLGKSYLPSRHIEQDDKLFFWEDKSFKTTDKMVEVLKKYKMIRQSNLHATFSVDESQKAIHYYICRNNYKNFKKVTTNIGIGYYDAPKISCN